MRDLLTNVSHDLAPLTRSVASRARWSMARLAEGARKLAIIGEEPSVRRLSRTCSPRPHRIWRPVLAAPSDRAGVAHATQPRRAQEERHQLQRARARLGVILGDPHRLAQVLDNLIERPVHPPTATSTSRSRSRRARPPAGHRHDFRPRHRRFTAPEKPSASSSAFTRWTRRAPVSAEVAWAWPLRAKSSRRTAAASS